jgi:hypothetical protein
MAEGVVLPVQDEEGEGDALQVVPDRSQAAVTKDGVVRFSTAVRAKILLKIVNGLKIIRMKRFASTLSSPTMYFVFEIEDLLFCFC